MRLTFAAFPLIFAVHSKSFIYEHDVFDYLTHGCTPIEMQKLKTGAFLGQKISLAGNTVQHEIVFCQSGKGDGMGWFVGFPRIHANAHTPIFK